MLNADFRDMLSALSEEGVEFLVVGVGGTELPVLALDDLIRNKEATDRLRDRADVEALRSLHEQGESPG